MKGEKTMAACIDIMSQGRPQHPPPLYHLSLELSRGLQLLKIRHVGASGRYLGSSVPVHAKAPNILDAY